MASDERFDGGPRSAIVVGAGIVGLSTAWFLQERGVAVTVVDRRGVAAGASWGNAGWVSPALTIPLNQPSALVHGLRSLAQLGERQRQIGLQAREHGIRGADALGEHGAGPVSYTHLTLPTILRV